MWCLGIGANDVGSIHSLGLVGHIEDIAVAKDQQGKKLGLRIIQALDHVAEQVGCYKVSFPFISSRGREWETDLKRADHSGLLGSQ